MVNCLLSCCYPYLLDPESNFRYPRKIENCKIPKYTPIRNRATADCSAAPPHHPICQMLPANFRIVQKSNPLIPKPTSTNPRESKRSTHGTSWRRSSASRSRPPEARQEPPVAAAFSCGGLAAENSFRCEEDRRKEPAAPIGGEEKGGDGITRPNPRHRSVNVAARIDWGRQVGEEKSNPRQVGDQVHAVAAPPPPSRAPTRGSALEPRRGDWWGMVLGIEPGTSGRGGASRLRRGGWRRAAAAKRDHERVLSENSRGLNENNWIATINRDPI
jgi:hypothetical protein